MPVKRRVTKRREQLCEDAERWLRGEPCGFFEFKNDDELAALWAEYGDPKIAAWNAGHGSRGRGRPVDRLRLEPTEPERVGASS
jgi:hypothetical protein